MFIWNWLDELHVTWQSCKLRTDVKVGKRVQSCKIQAGKVNWSTFSCTFVRKQVFSDKVEKISFFSTALCDKNLIFSFCITFFLKSFLLIFWISSTLSQKIVTASQSNLDSFKAKFHLSFVRFFMSFAACISFSDKNIFLKYIADSYLSFYVMYKMVTIVKM